MTARTHVSVWISNTLTTEAGEAVLASLPVSFERATDRAAASVVVLDGQAANWTAGLAASTGQRVILVDPGLARASRVDAPFVLDTPWGSNPVCACVAEELVRASWQRIECRSVVGLDAEPAQALLHLVSLLRYVGVELDSLRVLLSSATGVSAVATAGDRTADLGVTSTSALASHAWLRAFTAAGDVSVTLPEPTTARPAELVVTDARGSLEAPTMWESAHRATWRRVLADAWLDDSGSFWRDADLVEKAFSRKEAHQ